MSRTLQITCDRCGELIGDFVYRKGEIGFPTGSPKRKKMEDICNDCKKKPVQDSAVATAASPTRARVVEAEIKHKED